MGEDALARIYCAAEALAGVSVFHINTTAHGGGVAELLESLLPLMEEPGIPHSWKTISMDEASNLFDSHLVDLLQGMEHDDISEAYYPPALFTLYPSSFSLACTFSQWSP